jgi:hypothetical protein
MRGLLVVMAVAACAAPSRRLTPRVVEDPIVLPRRMASIALSSSAVHYEPTDANNSSLVLHFRYGLTDRLEWVDLLSLRFAILDDRPADGRTPMPLSLAVRAGVRGLGYSSLEGWIVLPIASIDVLKHVADRWALSLTGSWEAQWTQYEVDLTPAYGPSLGYATRHFSIVSLSGAATRQLSERIALGAGPSIAQTTDCISPTCDWVSRSAGLFLRLSARPWHWLTLSVAPSVGVRYRPNAPLPVATYPDGTPITVQPLSVTWTQIWGAATFYW